jgi:hypothetical protein
MREVLARNLTSTLVSLVVGIALGGWYFGGSRMAMAPSATVVDERAVALALDALGNEVIAIHSRLDRLDAAETLGSRREATREAAAADAHPRWEEAAKRLEAQLSALVEQLAMGQGVLSQIEPREKDVAAVNELVSRYLEDDHWALQSIFTWTPAAVYRRYGFPDAFNSGPGLLEWTYFHGESGVVIRFTNGVVASMTYRSRSR